MGRSDAIDQDPSESIGPKGVGLFDEATPRFDDGVDVDGSVRAMKFAIARQPVCRPLHSSGGEGRRERR